MLECWCYTGAGAGVISVLVLHHGVGANVMPLLLLHWVSVLMLSQGCCCYTGVLVYELVTELLKEE